jgi:hypothetical protein
MEGNGHTVSGSFIDAELLIISPGHVLFRPEAFPTEPSRVF